VTRPNWFFAFPIAGAFVSALPPPPPAIRLFHPDDVHLTLSFLGGCGAVAAERGLLALDEALGSHRVAPVSVSLSEVVPMGRKREYTALSALLAVGRSETEQLIRSLGDVVSRASLGRLEERAPKPHVTIARPLRRASEEQRHAGLAWASALDLGHVAAELDRVALYTWSDDRRERSFCIVAERVLSGE